MCRSQAERSVMSKQGSRLRLEGGGIFASSDIQIVTHSPYTAASHEQRDLSCLNKDHNCMLWLANEGHDGATHGNALLWCVLWHCQVTAWNRSSAYQTKHVLLQLLKCNTHWIVLLLHSQQAMPIYYGMITLSS